jgi:O-antigen ligase
MFEGLLAAVLIVLIVCTVALHQEALAALFLLGQPLLAYALSFGHGASIGRTVWDPPQLAVSGLAALVVLRRGLRTQGTQARRQLETLFGVIAAEIILLALSVTYSPDPTFGLQKLSDHVVFELGGLVLVLATVQTAAELRRFLWYCLLLGSVTALLVLFYMIELHGSLAVSLRLSQEEMIFHGFRLPSSISLGYRQAVVGAIAISLFSLTRPQQRVRRAFLLISTGLSIYLILASGSRGAALSLVVFGAIAPFLRRHRTIASFAPAVILLVATALLFQLTHPSAQARFRDTTLEDRTATWSFALELFRSHPLTGVGLGGYGYYEIAPGHRTFPHNVFLEYLTEAGILGSLPIMILISMAAARALQLLRSRSSTDQEQMLAVGRVAIFIIGCGHASVGSVIGSMETLWLSVGLLFSPATQKRHAECCGVTRTRFRIPRAAVVRAPRPGPAAQVRW